MGNFVSSDSKLPPLSLASTILGIITFPVSFLTLIKLIWSDLATLWAAQDEIPDYLGNLKQALYEEKAHLRLIRRRHRGEFEEGAFAVLANSVKHMIRDFKALEDPFLDDPPDAYDRKRKYDLDQADPEDYYNHDYHHPGPRLRFKWLRTRGKIIRMEERLSRIQTRRIAKQTADMAIDQHYLCGVVQDLEERIVALDDKRSNGVGMRRVV